MKKTLLFISIIFICLGCTNSESAKRLLEIEGFKDVQITGYSFFACSQGDIFSTGFKATKNSKVIEGTVCEGLFKNKTIRYE